MEKTVTDPLSYANDADQSVLDEIARLDGLRVSLEAKTVLGGVCSCVLIIFTILQGALER